MGNCAGGQADPEDRERSRDIDKGLRNDRQQANREVKLLLLGAGEAGKSTFAKQMRFLYGEGFSEEDRVLYKGFITSHLLTSFRMLLFAIHGTNLYQELGFDKYGDAFDLLMQPDLDPAAWNYFDFVVANVDAIKNGITQLWGLPAMKNYYTENQSKLQIFDTADYFFDNVDRILMSTFIPSDADILSCRVRTSGVLEYFFNIERNIRIRLIDVGGQRSERRKWIHCFEGVQSVLFFAALSEYDQALFEDQRQNRMRESLQLFHDACGCPYFQESAVVLFLNKVDLFRKKIQKVDLNVCFKSYTGGCDYDKALEFIAQRFKKEASDCNKKTYLHVTCATDTQMVKKGFDSVKNSIFERMVANSV
mmetsp:Transcript_3837/g.4960  ORF Transcript_3837/g.4960 Transcript_3837/m.4960 type:complete len:364 (-) Transcript_3837:121-1212(-)|eukprot:CAMPEP_0201490896 /NCGR_PEP_ID=MMETSP0151_2-20130828/27847_1 /ASSEMBLY_ACC=CAM_ASM_000257 /TAXON_ID=200890 /ORGANISM="Paramoeba atlantica, Strain 621/1 / CCAP 1560/9" /LENGTH=363 /DNA_ID=CAMNT_0047877031 /DNA_START=127 /DNA_END=1218 /DNA_ORIENTATION=-